MEKIYYQEPYLKKIQCAVTGVKHTDRGTEVLTDRTVFYPEGGGQPGDCGTLGEWTVRDTRKADNGDSILILDGDCHVETNQNLELELDWKHRFRYMVLHTAQHLVSGLLYSQFGIGTVSVHLGDGFITIETDRGQIDGETTDRLVRIANEKIRENHRILYREMSHAEAEALGLRRSIKVDGDVRIVEIEGVDRIACGGVHVGTTSEIGVIVFAGSENIRGHVRLVFECGEAAADRACERAMLLGSIAKNLSCSEAELPVKIHSLTDEIAQLKAALKTAQKKNALTEITSHLEGDVACFETDTDLAAVIQATSDFENIALCAVNAERWVIVLNGRYSHLDFNLLRQNVLASVKAKGGGKSPVFQGIADFSQTGVQTFLLSVKSLFQTL